MTAEERQELHLDVSEPDTPAVQLLASASGLSRQRIKRAMQCGAVWLGRGRSRPRRLRRADRLLQPGDQLHLYYDPQILATTPPSATLVADLDRYSVWDKPQGMWSQGSKWGDHCTIQRWAERHLQRPAFIVHRLDRAARGLILIAHGKSTAAALAALFRDRQMEKHYRAWVHGRFAKGEHTLSNPLEDRPAVSHVRHLTYLQEQDRTLLEIHIETGRKHQIRRHLQQSGHPIVGDRLYGNGGDEEDLQLEACRLAFVCPLDGERRCFELPATD